MYLGVCSEQRHGLYYFLCRQVWINDLIWKRCRLAWNCILGLALAFERDTHYYGTEIEKQVLSLWKRSFQCPANELADINYRLWH